MDEKQIKIESTGRICNVLLVSFIIIISLLIPTDRKAEAKDAFGFVIEDNVLVEYFGTDEVVTIPEGVTKIDEDVFAGKEITKVIIPNSVKEIGEVAFRKCYLLSEVSFGNSVTSIGTGAFQGCIALENLTIPSSVTDFGFDVFEDTPWYTKLCDSEPLVIINGILIYGGNSKGDLVLPDTVKVISETAFSGNKMLTGITIPDSVTVISNAAFEKCINLEYVKMGNSIKLIEDRAFEYCGKLTEILIPKSVKVIGGGAFYQCKKLKSVTIKNPDIELKGGVFEDTAWLTAQQKKNPMVILNHNLIDGSGCSGKVTVPKTVTRICSLAFDSNKGIKSVTLPDNIEHIGFGSFRDCSKLTSINLPTKLISIGESAFEACTSLKTISIPKSVKDIGESAFAECYSLTTVKNKSTITSIKNDTFRSCHKLKEVEIPKTVNSIGIYAFLDCDKLIRVDLPKNLERIEAYAFDSCEGLTTLKIPEKIKYVGIEAFNLNPWLYDIKGLLIVNHLLIDGSSMKGNVVIPDTVTAIAPGAFSNRLSEITGITIPDSVTSIGHSAFSMCDYLKKVVLPNSLKTIESGMFIGCDSLEEIVIPDSVTRIESSAFALCENLKSVKVSSNLMRIDDFAFQKCKKLTRIDGLNPKASIYHNAFKDTLILYKFYIDMKDEYAIVGGTYDFDIKTTADINQVVWTVSDSSLASIHSETGVLHAKTAGELTITATAGSLVDSRKLKIVESQQLQIIGKTQLAEGEIVKYHIDGLPEGTTVNWSLSEDDKAQIIDNYTSETSLLAFQSGTVTLCAQTQTGYGEITINIGGISISGSSTIKMSEEAVYTISSDSKDFEWYLSDEELVSFVGEPYGKSIRLRGWYEGTVTLTAMHSETGSETSMQITIEYKDISPEYE
jgi:hypothetical protein